VLTGGTTYEKYDKRVMARKHQSADSRNNSPQMKELLGYMARHHEDLAKTFTDEQKEIFEKFHDCWSEYASLSDEALFEYAFKFGMQIAVETLLK